jgi:NAD(P)-dependent dehydrogenase (short-subunit alcohol dehydrogenase family)
MKKISELMSLSNRNAIVTGGGGHIGLAICETLMELGATVSVLDLNSDICQERCRLLNSRHYQSTAIPVTVDLLKERDTREAVSHAIREMGNLDILVHAAAFVGTTDYAGWTVPFEEQTVDAWDKAMRINLTSAFIMIQTARAYLEKSANASVILIGSIYGLMGPDSRLYEETNMVTPAGYAASKGALIQLSRYLATSIAPHIRVNTIIAGGVQRMQPENFQKKYCDRTPLRRMATEEDLKGAVAYLASDLSLYVTGTELMVDGGWTAW